MCHSPLKSHVAVHHLKYFIDSVDFSTFMSGKIDFVLSLGFFLYFKHCTFYVFICSFNGSHCSCELGCSALRLNVF